MCGSMGHEDGEGVVDDEGRDEQGDHGEHDHERVEERQRISDRVLLLGDQLVTGDDLDPVGHHLRHTVTNLHLGNPGGCDDGDGIEPAWLAQDLLGRGEIEHRHRRPERRVRGPERGDTDDGERARRALKQDGDLVTDPKRAVFRGSAIDHDLLAIPRFAPFDEGHRVQLGGLDPGHAEGGRTLTRVAERVPLGRHQLGVSRDVTFRGDDPVHRYDHVEQVCIDPTSQIAEIRLDDVVAADRRIDPFVHRREQVVEGLSDGVEQHQ